jgi:hypothetical protein
MAKRFNITGKCYSDKHFMADVSDKMNQVLAMAEHGDYFIISRPRQYGKTTTLYTISDLLRKTGNFIVLNMSFEGVGDVFFEEEINFSRGFVRLLAKYASAYAPEFEDWLVETAPQIEDLDLLDKMITKFVNKTDKKVVILIDEVDKSSNNQLFISFLAMLRNKYLERDIFKTFHSVILAGVHDVKSLKLKLRPDQESKYNSPWNIATEFKVDMNLQVHEMIPMLEDYVQERNIPMDTKAIAEHLFYYTSGYPFLVSKLCKIVDEELMPLKEVKTWTIEIIDEAAQILIKNDNTNFETLAKNLENNENLYRLVYQVAIDGERIQYNTFDPTINFGVLYGIFVNKNSIIFIHNRIYQEVLVDYMTVKMQMSQLNRGVDFGAGYKNPDKSLNMEIVMTKFQTFMREQYSKHDRDFLERNGRLVFLAFLKPIINGSGHDFKEPQISEERRLDVIITHLQHKYLAELKIWRGKTAHEEGLLQLCDYLDRLSLTEGYLLIFDHSKRKIWKKEWTEVNGKKIFMVWV